MRARASIVVCVLLAAWPGGSAGAQSDKTEERTLRLEVGEQLSVAASGVEQYSEGLAGIVDVRLSRDKSQFVLVALSPGTTTLLMILKSGRQIRYAITVDPRDKEGAIKPRANVRLDFYFVQLSGDGAYRVGIGWPGTIGGTAQVSAIADLRAGQLTSATASVAAQVLPRIDLAQSLGWVRVLRQASLVVANGDLGAFSSGNEINILAEGNLATGIESIRFGSEVRVRPRYDVQTGRSEIQITAEVSDITEAGTSLPGRTVSRVETLVNLDLGQSIVLAGLNSRSESKSREGLPLLSQIPVIGALFGVHGSRHSDVENLLFIVPSVAEPIALDKRNLIQEAFRAFARFEGRPGELGKSLNATPVEVRRERH